MKSGNNVIQHSKLKQTISDWPFPENLYRALLGNKFQNLPDNASLAAECLLNHLEMHETKVMKAILQEKKEYEAISNELGIPSARLRAIFRASIKKLQNEQCLQRLGKFKTQVMHDIDESNECPICNAEQTSNYDDESLKMWGSICLNDMDIDKRLYNRLIWAGITNLAELVSVSDEELLSIRNFGMKSYQDVLHVLSRFGIERIPFKAMERLLVPREEPNRIADSKTVKKSMQVCSMSVKNEPVMHVDQSAKVVFEMNGIFHKESKSQVVNPATGPLYVKGAMPGDVLAVTINKISIAGRGVINYSRDTDLSGLSLTRSISKEFPIEQGSIIFSREIIIPVRKTIGFIAVTPKKGAIPCQDSGMHGGNMECRQVQEGSTVLLPVYVPGALLALGGLHAALADGEIGVSGLEVSGEVTITTNVIKDKQLPLPMIIGSSYVTTVASHSDLGVASNTAVRNMLTYLTSEGGFSNEDAAMLVSILANVRTCKLAGATKTARVEFPLRYLPDSALPFKV